jgi:hypothetical protein
MSILGKTGGIEKQSRGYVQFQDERGKTRTVPVTELDGKMYVVTNYSMIGLHLLEVYKVETIRGNDVTLRHIASKRTISRVIAEEEKQIQSAFRSGLLANFMED